MGYDRDNTDFSYNEILIGKNKERDGNIQKSSKQAVTTRVPHFRLSVKLLNISHSSNTLGHFMHLVILMTEHQLQMPISLAHPLVADESYFSSTV